MVASYEILVAGSPPSGRGGYRRFANLTLVTTGEGTLLFDTGHMMNRADLVAALARRGLRPRDIDRVFLSHSHFDHVDNIDLFPGAKVFLGRQELAYSRTPARDDAFVPWLIGDELQSHDLELLDGETDLGWGLRAVDLPGHTPGSMGIMFDGAGGVVVLAGDALADPAAVDCHGMAQGRRPPAFDDGDRLRSSACRVLAMADVIIPGHFGELHRVGPMQFQAVGADQ